MRDNLAYAAGDFGCNMSFALKGTMVIFWTQFMQMDSVLYAFLLLLCQVWDAINDPLIGSVIDADRHQYKRNKFLQYIWVGSIGLLVAGSLCFLPWPSAPKTAKILIFICGYVLWDAFYTIANVPYGSLLSLISSAPGDRASLSAWRSIGCFLGQMVTMALLPMIIYDSDNNIVGERVFFAALAMGLLGFLAFRFMLKNTVIRVEDDAKCRENRPKFSIIKSLGNFMTNRPAIGATIAAMGLFLGLQGGTTAVTVLFQSYFNNAQVSGVVMVLSMLPVVLFTPLARRMVAKYGKKELAVAGSLCSIVSCVLMIALPVPPDNRGIIVFLACQMLNALGMGIYSTVSWSMMGDAIDYNEWKHGTREEGTVYALHSFFRKLAQGFGPSIILIIMASLGYVEADQGNQAFEVAERMRYLVPSLFMVSSVMQFIGLGLIYNLDKKTLEKMNTDLNRNS